MNLGENSPSYSGPARASSFHRSVMVVLQILRLLKSMRRLCIDPAAAGVKPEPDEISTGSRKEKESVNPSDHRESRYLKLQFSNNISGPIYTGRPIGGDLGSTLNLDLLDYHTEHIVTFGSEASAKVEIVALEKEEFRIATSWPCGKSLIRGDPHVNLKDGRVSLSHISFKHTRVPMRKRELRLGARAVYPSDMETRITEAVTEPFFVIDRRSMPKSKRALNLDDQVWKLQTIGKGGPYHDCLMKAGIKTAGDFLTHYFLNREKLLNILDRRMHIKKLEAAVNQARSKIDLKRYLYPSAHPRVVFTEVGELIGALYQEGQFVYVEQLTRIQKGCAMELVKEAFEDGHRNSKVLDDDNFKKIFSSSSPTAFDDSNGFSCEAYDPSGAQQHPVPSSANFLPSTSTNTTATNNYDSIISQINSSATPTGALVPDCRDPDENGCTYQSLWDYYY